MLTKTLLLTLLAAISNAADCNRTATGREPLTEPYALIRQPGRPGGLYPGGANIRPTAHEAAGLAAAAQVRPRNVLGAPAEDGRVVLLSLGMSNATQEFSVFRQLAMQDSDLHPALDIIDGAQGGWSADRIVADPAPYWNEVDRRIRTAGLTPQQVQAVWLKQADAEPDLAFPDDARKLGAELEAIATETKNRFPNIQLLYFSSRTYGGYAVSNLNPEPFAYQSGFAVKWLIESEIFGVLEQHRFPWMAWGPYLWADGMTAREDGLTWTCGDVQTDGTHPSRSGQLKVAGMLLDFFKTDTTARPWFLRPIRADRPEIRTVLNSITLIPAVAPGGLATISGPSLALREESAPGLPLPTYLGGAVVRVGGRAVPLYSASPTQIRFVVPGEVPVADLTVEVGDQVSETGRVPIQTNAPGLLTVDGLPEGAAAARHADGSVVDSLQPARIGEIITLSWSGQGVRNPLILAPDALPLVRVGDVIATVYGTSPAAGFPGMRLIRVEIPADAPSGETVPVVLQLAGFMSNRARIAVTR